MLDVGHILGCSIIPCNVGHSLRNTLVMLDVGHILGCSTFNVDHSLINFLVMVDVGHFSGYSTIPVMLAKAEKTFL
jgi:hypothetical protein